MRREVTGATMARPQITPSVILTIAIVVIVQATVLSHMWPYISAGRVDFRSLYEAGTTVLHRGAPAYQLSVRPSVPSAAEQMDPLRFRNPQGPDNLHPPFELLIFTPLAALPYRVAYLVWYCCNSLMLMSVLLALWKHIPELHSHLRLLLFAGATAYPVLVSLSQGQDSILLLLLLTLSFLSLKEGHEFRAGVALGMGMFKFLLVGPIVLGLMVARRWRTLAAYGVTCVALLLASFALIGAKAATSYWFFIFRFGRVTPPVAKLNRMPSLREFSHALVPKSVPAMWVDVVVIGLSVLILAFVLVRCANAARAEVLDLRFSMLVTTATVISYHFFVHNATILLLPVLLAANHFAGPGRHAFARVPFLIAVAAMYFAPFVISEPADMLVFFCGSVVLLLTLYRSTTRDASQDFSSLSRSVTTQCRAANSADYSVRPSQD